jgi:hypothetical protein
MDDQLRDYTLEQVLSAERRAWACEGDCTYRCDGIYSWFSWGDEMDRADPLSDVPKSSWRHAPDCNCRLCMAPAESSCAAAPEFERR